MNFRYEGLNKEIFDKVVAFSYSIGSGLGGPGAMIMLTRDGKEYIIGQEALKAIGLILRIPEDEDTEKYLLQGYDLLLFKRIDTARIDGVMMMIAFQREQCSEGVHTMNAKVEAYNLFYRRIEDVRGPLEIPVDQGKSPMIELENSFSGNLSCYSVNTRGEFIRSYSSMEEAKMGAMYWLKVWGGIDSENVIPYGTIRSDEEEVHKRDVREAELYMTFITRYADVIEVIKKYDYPGNAADEVAAVLGITRDEVGFIYDMFDPVLFSDSRIQTIKTMLEDTL